MLGKENNMERFYKRFVSETIVDGRLKDISFNVPEDFNFAYDVVDEIAKDNRDKKAMIWVSENGEEHIFTFSDMADQSARAANYLYAKGVRKGDRVMVVLKRHYQFWFVILALHRIGAVAIPATHLLMKKDFIYRFESAGVSGIICTNEDDVCHQVELAAEEYSGLERKFIINEDRQDWDNLDKGIEQSATVFARPQGAEGVRRDDMMLMYFTSGTTGYPKICTHRFDYPIGHIVTAVWWHNVQPDGLHFTMSETGWAKSMWGKLYGQWLGESCIFTYDFEKFKPHEILLLFAKFKITTFCAPPTIYRFFIKEDLKAFDLSSLKYAVTAGEALNAEVFKQFKDCTGLMVMEGFGQTETTLTLANLVGDNPKPGSMGLPNPQYDIDLIDADGNSVEDGVPGEIVVNTNKGAPVGMFAGYYRDSKQTKAAWHDNVYHTGDMAWRDEDGHYWFVGRTDDIIKSSGYRIGPFEIESTLMEHPAVLECAVTGVPDPDRGQVVKATIVLAKGYTASEELVKQIQDYVKHQTAPYKYPRVIEFCESLPKTISGKIKRTVIRGEASE